ncbi:G/U mismatch-specific DNA glycosylase [Planotetraspora kaengkrachanensis]|uniref:Mismatch-specific DNA-glycosylase n=1 Tax=Planotetraspora kaengkrachanensis TaxID=575193 RepID=A0A8J3PTF8_9ACTN|nr:G/U mismatch-specific DNA glycosylase [Planotetraspora kaengkrachanensis]GIG79766.1 mismatch-specific DNA-glycosylase [Planotetraspora kaengkrachanensis]
MPPTKAELEAARDATIPDVIGPGLDVLFCGINPGLYSAATGFHFARPGNRFWPALHLSGLVPRLLAPHEQGLLPSYGLGITNLAPRATARAEELTPGEIREGGARLADLVRSSGPRVLAVCGVSAYRVAFGRPKAAIGPQDDVIGGAAVWVLPNPSGLNAHWRLEAIAAEMARLRPAPGGVPGETRVIAGVQEETLVIDGGGNGATSRS